MTPIDSLGGFAPAAIKSGQKGQRSPEKIAEAAKQFESIILQQFLKSARQTSESQGGIFSSGQGNDTFTSIAEEHFAQALAAQGGLGLARLVAQGLLRDQGSGEPKADQNKDPQPGAAISAGSKP